MEIPNIEPNFDDLQSWCDRVPGLRESIIGLKTSGFCGITPPIMGALVELGLFGNRAAMAQAAEILQSS